MNSLLLLAIGLLLIFLEFFVPGAVFGALGGVAIAISILLFAMETNSALLALGYLAVVTLLIILLIKFTLWRIRKTKVKQSIYSDADQEGFVASTFDRSAIGKKGIVLSDLKPGGYIVIGDTKYQAISISGYLIKGTAVEVIDGQEESLIVKTMKEEIT